LYPQQQEDLLSSQSAFAADALATIAVSSRAVRVVGEIDISNVAYLAQSLRDAIETGWGPDIVVDLTELSFLDVQGLDALVASQHLARVSGKRLMLANPPGMVSRLLALTGLDVVLPVSGLRSL
jgi:anti-sigma B factor antagonist